MDRNSQNSDSPLLLKLPKSMLSFSDMTGNSFLMPVAVDSVVDSENATAETKPEKEDNTKVPETSVCQLQQPLLVRRSSSPAFKTAVPDSKSNEVVTNVDLTPTKIFKSQKHEVSSVLTSDQNNESMNWPASSVDSSGGQPIQTTPVFTYQNLPTLQSGALDQTNYSQSVPINQESSSLRFQTIFSPQPPTAFSSYDNFPPPTAPDSNYAFPNFSQKSGDYCTVSSSYEYYSPPPVITPSAAPSYYNTIGSNTSQTPLCSSIPGSQSYNLNHSSNMPTEMYSRLYEPVRPYWLFKDIVESKEIWCGFSVVDSDRLEIAFQQDPQAIVPVDGGRYDAVLTERIKNPVYFEGKSLQIRRCIWFFRSESSQRFTPFPEEASSVLEQHYSNCVTSGHWQKRVNIPGLGSIVFENPEIILYYMNEIELWPTLPDSKASPKSVKRGLPENYEILQSENSQIDHLIFIVQGIGSFCDLRFRTVSECVDGFRDIANKLLSSHFKCETDKGRVGRVEFLPLAWHAKLHTSDKGFDRCMQNITLPSIPKLRHFTNDTLLDILLYSSPFYCQSIIDTVTSELNKLYELFLKRNPNFSGKVFVAGHSLGSLILFDILSHQQLKNADTTTNNEVNSEKIPLLVPENVTISPTENGKDAFDSINSLLQACNLEDYAELFEKEKIDLTSLALLSNDDLKDLGLLTGPRKRLLNAVHSNEVKSSPENGKILTALCDLEEENPENVDFKSFTFPFKTSPCMQSIIYPRLQFEPACFFALGSPISMFLTVRGYDRISEDFKLPTCPNFFHIFHPYDPVAFRIECLIDPNFSAKPVLIPHHKGRKRMHLEIRENLSKVGFEIKQKVLETLKYTWNSLSGFAKAHTFPSAAVEAEVDKLVSQQISVSEYDQQAPSETSGEEIQIGSLNGGRRIDYVLQEKPIEALNDYIFALTSHATYWDSEDTVLMILREVYATEGIVVSSYLNIENKPLIFPDQSSYEAPSNNFNPCEFDSTRTEQIPSTSAFYNQNMPPIIPVTTQSMQMFSSYGAPVPQIANNMPLSSTITTQQVPGPPPLSSATTLQQSVGPSLTSMQQLVGPSSLTSATIMQQPAAPSINSSATIMQQPAAPSIHSTATTLQQPAAPSIHSSATTLQQPVGPPPLSGFIKKSPFTR